MGEERELLTRTEEKDFNDPDSTLFRGRQGESILERKATSSESHCILAVFLLAFSFSQILGVDVNSHGSHMLANAHVVLMSVSAGAGTASVFLFTFLSAKIHRLIGRSEFFFGSDADAKTLRKTHGEEKLKARLEHALKNNNVNEVRFNARAWYYTHNNDDTFSCSRPSGQEHYRHALLLFMLQVLAFMFGVTCNMLAKFETALAATSVACMIIMPIAALGRLFASGAMADLT